MIIYSYSVENSYIKLSEHENLLGLKISKYKFEALALVAAIAFHRSNPMTLKDIKLIENLKA